MNKTLKCRETPHDAQANHEARKQTKTNQSNGSRQENEETSRQGTWPFDEEERNKENQTEEERQDGRKRNSNTERNTPGEALRNSPSSKHGPETLDPETESLIAQSVPLTRGEAETSNGQKERATQDPAHVHAAPTNRANNPESETTFEKPDPYHQMDAQEMGKLKIHISDSLEQAKGGITDEIDANDRTAEHAPNNKATANEAAQSQNGMQAQLPGSLEKKLVHPIVDINMADRMAMNTEPTRMATQKTTEATRADDAAKKKRTNTARHDYLDIPKERKLKPRHGSKQRTKTNNHRRKPIQG